MECVICLEPLVGGSDNNDGNNLNDNGNNNSKPPTIGAAHPCGHCFHVECWKLYECSRIGHRSLLSCPMCKEKTKSFCRLYIDLGSTTRSSNCRNDDQDSDKDNSDTDERGKGSYGILDIKSCNHKKALKYKLKAKEIEQELERVRAEYARQVNDHQRLEQCSIEMQQQSEGLVARMQEMFDKMTTLRHHRDGARLEVIQSNRERDKAKEEAIHLQRQIEQLKKDLVQKERSLQDARRIQMTEVQDILKRHKEMNETIHKLRREVRDHSTENQRLASILSAGPGRDRKPAASNAALAAANLTSVATVRSQQQQQRSTARAIKDLKQIQTGVAPVISAAAASSRQHRSEPVAATVQDANKARHRCPERSAPKKRPLPACIETMSDPDRVAFHADHRVNLLSSLLHKKPRRVIVTSNQDIMQSQPLQAAPALKVTSHAASTTNKISAYGVSCRPKSSSSSAAAASSSLSSSHTASTISSLFARQAAAVNSNLLRSSASLTSTTRWA